MVIQGASRFPPSSCAECGNGFSPFGRAKIREDGRLVHPECAKPKSKEESSADHG